MKVAFLLNDLALSGGVGVVVEHARRLHERPDFEAALVLVRELEVEPWQYRGLGDLPVLALPDAAERRWDVAVATWWETTFSLFRLEAGRYAWFIQSLEDRFYDADDPARHAASLTHDLPVDFITEARWIARTLERKRPGTRVFLVRNGIDKAAFPVPERLDSRVHPPLRVAIEGYPRVAFKGVEAAAWTAGAMTEPRHVTVVTPEPEQFPAGLPADDVVGPLSQREMSDLYARTDVVLKLSRVEGMFGPPLEGFHRGATCVVTPVTGHEEYVVHGWNGLAAEWDDPRGTARALDLLARDRRLLQFLRLNAVETARAWPSWEQSSEFMAAALRRIAVLPPPSPYAPGAALAADIRAGAQAHARTTGERDRLDAAIAPWARFRERRLVYALRRWRHRPVGRALTWPARKLVKLVIGRS